MSHVLVIGHDEPQSRALAARCPLPVITSEMLPRIRVWRDALEAESSRGSGDYVPISRVVFHGIFEDDGPFLAALCLWGGPCWPRPRGMLDCRSRLPCLVRSLDVTRFGTTPRGFASARAEFLPQGDAVAKWGEWHCGENKERFAEPRRFDEPALVEAFIDGEAVRVQMVGERAWQMRLGGPGWKKSIHDASSALMPPDADLVEDTRRLRDHFGLDIVGVDYMVAHDGTRHLLEVNHIPSVTAFAEVEAAYLEAVVGWLQETPLPNPLP
jgi:hypothetical protein